MRYNYDIDVRVYDLNRGHARVVRKIFEGLAFENQILKGSYVSIPVGERKLLCVVEQVIHLATTDGTEGPTRLEVDYGVGSDHYSELEEYLKTQGFVN